MVEETEVINEDLTNPTETESEETIEEVVLEEATPAPGSKTNPELLLKDLKEQREKTRRAEERTRQLEEQLSSSTQTEAEVYSDEGKLLQERFNKKIQSLENTISNITGEFTKKDVLNAHPEIKEKWEEFEEFQADPDNKGMSMKTCAKAFLIERGMYQKPRKGLEKPTGGDKSPKPAGLTAQDVKTLRETNWRKYTDMLSKGLIPADLQ